MIASEEEARAYCAGLVDASAMARLEHFAEALADENARQNLVSETSLAALWQRHIADSLQLLAHVPRETSPWLDLGTGAGAPGLIVAIARPDLKLHCVESRKRRIEWLSAMVDDLQLYNCSIVGARLEDVRTFPVRTISARAFAPLSRLLQLSSRFSGPDTVWLLPKGRSAAKELEAQPRTVQAVFHVEQSATDSEAGILIGRGVPKVA